MAAKAPAPFPLETISQKIVESDPRVLAATTAAVLGLASHQLFKRNEPTVYEFFGHVAFLNIGLTMLCKFIGVPTLELIPMVLIDLATYLFTLSTSIVLYRLFFHPLRGYPGPILCKITRFTASWHVITRDSHNWMIDLHKKYGDVVRVSPNELSFISASSVDSLHGSKAGKLARGPFYSGDPNRPANSMLSTQDLFEHKWRRKIWERGFGTLQLRDYEPRVIKLLDVLVAQLRRRVGTPINWTHWCEFFAYDVMSDLGFSEEFGMLEEGKSHEFVGYLHGATRVLTIAAQTPWIRPLMWLFPIDAKSKVSGKEFSKLSRATYDRRRAKDTKQHDMFEYIAAKSDGPRQLTEYELMADAALIIAAGSVSTALCITFIFSHLCRSRSQILKLQAEIDKCWDGISPLTAGQLAPQNAPYLDGVINESLRLWPPAPNGMQRRTPPEGFLVDGKLVPGNTQVSVHTMGIQRDARWFSRPDEFIPERWIDEERPKEFNHNAQAFIPFTIGQFACLGKNLAYQELRLFMAKVVRNFDFKFPDAFDTREFDEHIYYKGTFLISKLPVVFEERKNEDLQLDVIL